MEKWKKKKKYKTKHSKSWENKKRNKVGGCGEKKETKKIKLHN